MSVHILPPSMLPVPPNQETPVGAAAARRPAHSSGNTCAACLPAQPAGVGALLQGQAPGPCGRGMLSLEAGSLTKNRRSPC